MLRPYLFRHCLTDLLDLGHVLHRVQHLDVVRIDIGKAKGVKPCPAQVGVMAHAGEQLWPAPVALAAWWQLEIADLAI
ncbi:MAG: hypothetical protein WAO76_00795 [Georgfuchsia sp.]